jgi:predicted NBD/HSP70 family sugar kinase
MENTKVNSTLLKNVNRKKILSVIDNAETISRVEVKNLLDKNGKTVTNITNSLIEDGLVTPVGYSSFTGGRRRELLTINANYGYLVGVHLGIHFLRAIITDFKYKILGEEKIPIYANESQMNLLGKIRKAIDFLIKNAAASSEKLLGIGFAANGLYNDKTGEWIVSANNPNWANVPIKEILTKRYNVPVYVEQNTRAIALAERHFGVVKNSNNFIFIGLGVGIGSAIINENGRLYRGANNIAGEIGHVVVQADGDLCSCGKHGCLETVASGWAMLKKVKERIIAGEKSEILDLCNGDLEAMNIETLLKAFNNNDKLVTEIFETAMEYLSISIANTINMFNPDFVVLGEYFAELNKDYLSRLIKKTKSHIIPLSAKNTKILISSLGSKATVLGATTLVRDSYFYIDTLN